MQCAASSGSKSLEEHEEQSCVWQLTIVGRPTGRGGGGGGGGGASIAKWADQAIVIPQNSYQPILCL